MKNRRLGGIARLFRNRMLEESLLTSRLRFKYSVFPVLAQELKEMLSGKQVKFKLSLA
jgi:hypothetical protein